FFVNDYALRAQVGGPSVMVRQLEYLFQLTARPNITIRVITATEGAASVMYTGFRLMTLDHVLPVGYADLNIGGMFVEGPAQTAALQRILDHLAEHALDEGQSKYCLAESARRMALIEGRPYEAGQDQEEQ